MPTVSNSYFGTASASSSTTAASVVVGSGEGLVVLISGSDASTSSPASISGVTFGSQSLTLFDASILVDDGLGATRHRMACYYAKPADITPGTQTVTCTWGASVGFTGMAVFVIASPNTSTMVRGSAPVTASGGSTAPTINVTTVSGDLVLDFVRIRQSGGIIGHTAGAGQTELEEFGYDGSSNTWGGLASSEAATTTTTAMSWSPASDSAWNQIAVALPEAAAADPVFQPSVSQKVGIKSSIASAVALNSRRFG